MSRVRHRRHLHLYRFIAGFAPAVAVGSAIAAFLLQGVWMPIAAAAGALLSLLLGSLVLRLDRRRRIEVATVRANQATAYAAEHERYSAEHRSFTAHMVGLLDVARGQLGAHRTRLGSLEVQVALLRSTRTTSPAPSHELVRLTDGAEWSNLWPDVAEAPTVVDLLKWDDRQRNGLVSESDGHQDEQTA